MGRTYTKEEKEFILSKIKNIKWSQISETLRIFWLEYKNGTNEQRNNKTRNVSKSV